VGRELWALTGARRHPLCLRSRPRAVTVLGSHARARHRCAPQGARRLPAQESRVVTRESSASLIASARLDAGAGVRVYDLPGPPPPVRVVGGIVRAPHSTRRWRCFAIHPSIRRRPPSSGTGAGAEGEPSAGRYGYGGSTCGADRDDRLIARACWIWQRANFRRGVRKSIARADHCGGWSPVGVRTSGAHEWNRAGNLAKLGLGLGARFAAMLVSRRWNQRIVRCIHRHA
jgi:hypothetical protein